MANYRILVDGAYKGRSYNLEFALEKRPTKLIELDIPGSDDTVAIRADSGRKFGDAEAAGTPSRIKVGKWSAPALYYHKGDYGQIIIGEDV